MGNLQRKLAQRKKMSLKGKVASARKELLEIKANQNKINTLLDEFNQYVTFMEKREKYLRDFTKKAMNKKALEEGDVLELEVKEIESGEEESKEEEFTDFDMEDETMPEFGQESEEEETKAKEVVKKEMMRLKAQLRNLERKLK